LLLEQFNKLLTNPSTSTVNQQTCHFLGLFALGLKIHDALKFSIQITWLLSPIAASKL
jgi:hypothetical protein